MNERSQRLLKTLIERYIADGSPVGSKTLSMVSGLDLSSASIRNMLAELEEMGLIVSPHTSAGRVPTVKGYRLFVDHLLTIQPLEEVAVRELQSGLRPDSPQRIVAAASSLLSDLTHFAERGDDAAALRCGFSPDRVFAPVRAAGVDDSGDAGRRRAKPPVGDGA
ncbi:hypothetical protein [Paludibacterium denitrificans]|uniref:hypothetical protein n=1 Tax=Paludibacterium denitrificans TaxID=2675226 RepID=UPI001E2D7348|nr:hypothetical protein [Paludibacterium denitrificans]